MLGSTTPYIFVEIYNIFHKSPSYTLYLELFLLFFVIFIIVYKKKSNKKELSEEEKAFIIQNWTPEPLVAEVPEDHPALELKIVKGHSGKYINVDGIDCLNMGTNNFLGLLEEDEIREKAIKCLRKYGVGSCGPRGFYGTLDVHLELEERLAKFMDMEEAVVYSYAFSTIASAIPAYSKRGDIIFVDECVNFAVQKGLDASRSKIIYFKHNDYEDLEKLLREQEIADKKNPKKAARTRKFIVVEGIYLNTGEMCPLHEIIALRKKYKLRLILDESVSFGTFGENGRGITEYLQIDKTEIDLISASLESAVGSIGGFCVGSSFIVDHQRLSGLGYCFSASLPPLLAQAAICALDKFENEPKIFKEINECAEKFHAKLNTLSEFTVRGHPLSPLKHLYLKESVLRENELLKQISNECISNGLAVIKTEYLEGMEKKCPRPSLRVTVNRLLTDNDLDNAIKILDKISKNALSDK